MHKISDIAAAVTKIESLDEEAARVCVQQLRHLSQRLPFRPGGRAGRADLYDDANTAALRLVQLAADFGLDRIQLHAMTSYLLSVDDRAVRDSDRETFGHGEFGTAAIAVRHARDGEEFDMRIGRETDGAFTHRLDYDLGIEMPPAARKILSSREAPRWSGYLVIPASRHINELFRELEG